MQNLIYLHGFLSSPASVKAQQTLAYFTQHHPDIILHMPTLPGEPMQAIAEVEKAIQQIGTSNLCFVGSSMGGYLSTYFVEKYGGKAVIVNPAVKPFELLTDYQGKHVNHATGEEFMVTEKQIAELLNINTPYLKQAKQYMVLLQTGDETLDYRDAQSKYADSCLIIEQDGNHSFVGFESHLPAIHQFLFVQD